MALVDTYIVSKTPVYTCMNWDTSGVLNKCHEA